MRAPGPTCVFLTVVMLLAGPARLHAQAIPGAQPESTKALSQGEWPAYGGTYAAAHYSPLAQINSSNARNLHVAWRWKSPDQAIKEADPKLGPSRANEATPLMVGRLVFDGGASGAAVTGPMLAVAVPVPAELVAVTVTVTVFPTSDAEREPSWAQRRIAPSSPASEEGAA